MNIYIYIYILRDCLKLQLTKMNYANSFTIYTEKYIIPFIQ